MTDRLKMTVEMQVTEPQALALQAMFQHWKALGSMGCSRFVAFYVDGDGDFKPKCEVSFSKPIRELTDAIKKAALVGGKEAGKEMLPADFSYDYDPVSWYISENK